MHVTPSTRVDAKKHVKKKKRGRGTARGPCKKPARAAVARAASGRLDHGRRYLNIAQRHVLRVLGPAARAEANFRSKNKNVSTAPGAGARRKLYAMTGRVVANSAPPRRGPAGPAGANLDWHDKVVVETRENLA